MLTSDSTVESNKSQKGLLRSSVPFLNPTVHTLISTPCDYHLNDTWHNNANHTQQSKCLKTSASLINHALPTQPATAMCDGHAVKLRVNGNSHRNPSQWWRHECEEGQSSPRREIQALLAKSTGQPLAPMSKRTTACWKAFRERSSLSVATVCSMSNFCSSMRRTTISAQLLSTQ